MLLHAGREAHRRAIQGRSHSRHALLLSALPALPCRRRAAPPRPTLLVGDILQCHAAFDRLQQRVLELSLERQACIDETAGSSGSEQLYALLVHSAASKCR